MDQQGAARVGGLFLIWAASFFWVGWLLMPGVGLTDAAAILERVGARRSAVAASVQLHVMSSVFLAFALALLAALDGGQRRWFRLAAGLLGAGGCAVAADAIFHFVAIEMTAPGIDRDAVLPVMVGLQTRGLLLLIPLALCFFLGAGALAGAASRAGLVSRWNPRLHGIALATAVIGGALLGPRGGGRLVGLAVLGLVSASLAWVGVALWRGEKTG